MKRLLAVLLLLSACGFAQTTCVNCGGGVAAITDNGTNVTTTEPIVVPAYINTAPTMAMSVTGSVTNGFGIANGGSGPTIYTVAAGVRRGIAIDASGNALTLSGGMPLGWTSNATDPGAAGADTILSRDSAVGTLALKQSATTDAKFRVYGANGAFVEYGTATELLTLSTGGTTTDTTANLLPANSIIDAVDARVTTTITTATDWKLGDATIAARFSIANSTMTAGTTQVGDLQADQTGTSGPRQVASAKVRVTTTGTPGAGVIRITVHYHSFTPPTS